MKNIRKECFENPVLCSNSSLMTSHHPGSKEYFTSLSVHDELSLEQSAAEAKTVKPRVHTSIEPMDRVSGNPQTTSLSKNPPTDPASPSPTSSPTTATTTSQRLTPNSPIAILPLASPLSNIKKLARTQERIIQSRVQLNIARKDVSCESDQDQHCRIDQECPDLDRTGAESMRLDVERKEKRFNRAVRRREAIWRDEKRLGEWRDRMGREEKINRREERETEKAEEDIIRNQSPINEPSRIPPIHDNDINNKPDHHDPTTNSQAI